MLDFYWLLDTEEMPEYPDKERYIGGLEYSQAEYLVCIWEQCSNELNPNRGEIFFDGDTDFILRSQEVKVLLRYCNYCLDKVDPGNSQTFCVNMSETTPLSKLV